MPELYGRSPDGTNRKLRELYCLASGANRKLKELYGLSGGVNRKIFSGYDCQAAVSNDAYGRSYINSNGSGNLELYAERAVTPVDHNKSTHIDFYFNEPVTYTKNQEIVRFNGATWHSDDWNSSETVSVSSASNPAIAWLSYPPSGVLLSNYTGSTTHLTIEIMASLGRASYDTDSQFEIRWPSGGLYLCGRQINNIEIV